MGEEVISKLPRGSAKRNQLIIKNARRAKLCADMIACWFDAKVFETTTQHENQEQKIKVSRQQARLQATLQSTYDELQNYRQSLGKELISQVSIGQNQNLSTQTESVKR